MDDNLSPRDRLIIERMAEAVKKNVEDNQYLDEWEIAKAVFNEFKGEFETLDLLIDTE